MHQNTNMNIERWGTLLQSLNLKDSNDVYSKLVTAYSEPHKYYHTDKHISACLKYLDVAGEFSDKKDEVELAIWFHDAIYKTFSSNNEENSAIWAKNFLDSNKCNRELIERVYKLIIATSHNHEINTKDESLLVDIDLTILGEDQETYRQYQVAIRKEYKLIPNFIYRKKRVQILKNFLNRKSIYSNAFFIERLERQARENISNEIRRYKSRV